MCMFSLSLWCARVCIRLVTRSQCNTHSRIVRLAKPTCAGVHDVRALDELGRVQQQHEQGYGGREQLEVAMDRHGGSVQRV